MKKLLILLVAICCCGCNDTGTNTTEPSEKLNIEQYFKNSTTEVFTMEIEGHLYLVYDGHNACGILHAEHCPCKNK